MRNKISALTLLSIFILSIIPSAFAQEELTGNAGLINANNNFVWQLFDRAPEKIKMIFLSNEGKTNYLLKLADERAGEIREAKDEKIVIKVERERAKAITEIETRAANLNDEKKGNIILQIQKHLEVLRRVQESVPAQAKDAIARAIENTEDHELRIANSIKEINNSVTGEAKIEIEKTKARAKTRTSA